MATGFPGGASGKEPVCQAVFAGDITSGGLIPGSGRSPGRGHGSPLQNSCLENPMDRGAWQAAVHRVAKSQTRRKRLHTHTHTHTHTQVTVTCLTSVARTEVRSRGQRQGGGQRAAPAAVRNRCPRTAKQGLRTLVTNGRWTRRRKGVKDAFKERGRRS